MFAAPTHMSLLRVCVCVLDIRYARLGSASGEGGGGNEGEIICSSLGAERKAAASANESPGCRSYRRPIKKFF